MKRQYTTQNHPFKFQVLIHHYISQTTWLSDQFEMGSTSSPHHFGNPSPRFSKDKQGKMIIPSKDLNIVWGGDNRYWNIPQNQNLAVELYQVSWLEVTGSVSDTNPNKDYEVGFRISLTPDAFGWSASPIYIMVKRGKEGKFAWKKVSLNSNETEEFEISGKLMMSGKTGHNSNDPKIFFGLYEVWSGKWKGGLRIHHAFVRECR